MAVLKFKNGNSWEEIKIPQAVSLAGMCFINFNSPYYSSPAYTYGGTWTEITPSDYANPNYPILYSNLYTEGNDVRRGVSTTYPSGNNGVIIQMRIWLRTA